MSEHFYFADRFEQACFVTTFFQRYTETASKTKIWPKIQKKYFFWLDRLDPAYKIAMKPLALFMFDDKSSISSVTSSKQSVYVSIFRLKRYILIK